MLAYIIATGTALPPLEASAPEARILFEPLHRLRDRLLKSFGFEPVLIESPDMVGEGPCLITYDNVWFTWALLRDFLKRSRKGKARARAVLKPNLFTELTAPLQDLEKVPADGVECLAYNLFYLPRGDSGFGQLGDYAPLVSNRPELKVKVKTPERLIGRAQVEMPLTRSALIHIRHWVHVLQANQISIGVRWGELLRERKLWFFIRLLGGRLNRHHLAQRMVVKGKHTRIHPTAMVGWSVLGDYVEIGPKSYVYGSLIGDRCHLGYGARLEATVLGEDCMVAAQSGVVGALFYPGAVSSGLLVQASLLGEASFLARKGGTMDLNLYGDVKVRMNGEVRSTETNFLGGCLGKGARVGPEGYLAPGRELNSGIRLEIDHREMLSRIPPDLPIGVPLVIEKGTLKTLNEE